MCGVFGVVDFSTHRPIDPVFIERATDRMARRGPDGGGVWVSSCVGLGHRRLAIIDPEGSPQPMVSTDGRWALTYNGELYNYREIRRRLEAEGVCFQSKGDTEALMQALIRWGAESIKEFNGMFAFGLWDNQRRRLLLGRDRIGVKPLYYHHSGEKLIFASEFTALLAAPEVSSEPDRVGLTAYLAHYQPTFGAKTIYRDIRVLRPGSYAVFDADGFRESRYWSLPLIPSRAKRAEWRDERIPEAAETVRSLMTEAVSANCVADVEVGAFLSGGLDSAVILTLMAEQAEERVRAYSIGFAEKGFNEFEYSIPLVKDLNLRHTVVTLGREEYEQRMEELIVIRAAPLSTPNEIPIYALALKASEEIKVALTGEGSDEIFGGYGALLRSPYDYQSAQSIRENPESLSPEERRLKREAIRRLYGKAGFHSLAEHWMTAYVWLDRSDITALLTPDFASEETFGEIAAFWQERLEGLEGLDSYDRYLYLLEEEHLKGLLGRLDADTMAASLEGRVPFTDNALVDFVWSLPFDYKLRWREGVEVPSGLNSLELTETYDIPKFVLKEAFKGKLPEGILSRRKMAFPAPLDLWLGQDGGLEMAAKLERLATEPFKAESSAAWARARLGGGNGGMKVWMAWSAMRWAGKKSG